MDAVTAAVAIAVDHSRNAALEDCLLDRERQAMRAAHLESLIAQRMFTSSTQLPHSAPPVTWRTAHTIAHNETVQMRAVMDQAARAARRGHDERAVALLEAELWSPTRSPRTRSPRTTSTQSTCCRFCDAARAAAA